MKRNIYLACSLALCLAFLVQFASAQTSPVANLFPKATIIHQNISYANDTLKRHLMDIYVPAGAKENSPLIVFIHGGAWMLNDKYADMGYMKNTVHGFIDSGYVMASIDYRYSTDAPFPAQIQDCNQAVEYLYQHAAEYKIDKKRIAVIGFSAGGHLASLMALSNNNGIKEFYPGEKMGSFKIKCALDFYGPSDLIAISSVPDTSVNNERSPVSLLLGAMAVDRPDLAKRASPVTYIDKNDPPFLIVQGEKDQSVPNTQSKLLSSWLTLVGIKNELIIVPNAPHYGVMFDTPDIRERVFHFLAQRLR
jgi:acetyl esterase/lipase